jgi:hypothetical protein
VLGCVCSSRGGVCALLTLRGVPERTTGAIVGRVVGGARDEDVGERIRVEGGSACIAANRGESEWASECAVGERRPRGERAERGVVVMGIGHSKATTKREPSPGVEYT